MSVDAIDWSALHACYGPATSIPALLGQLASPQADKRSDAIAELWGCLCHQGTVYEASAVAVPFLFEAARSSNLTSGERTQLLALMVHIGLGEDTTWQGYTPWEIVQNCADAVEELLPDLTTWALEGGQEALTWTLALAAYHPHAWAEFGVDVDRLVSGLDAATAGLVRHAVSETLPEESLVAAVLSSDDDLRCYYDEVISELPPDRQARRLVLELAVTERL